jgi:hypothetical protein
LPRKKEVTATRSFGAVTKAEVFEELIWKLLGARVKLAPAEKKKKEETRSENLRG